MEGQCKAGQMLAALGLDLSLAGLQAATAKAAKDLLLLMLKQLADTQPPLLESRYRVTHEKSVLARQTFAKQLDMCEPLQDWIVSQYNAGA